MQRCVCCQCSATFRTLGRISVITVMSAQENISDANSTPEQVPLSVYASAADVERDRLLDEQTRRGPSRRGRPSGSGALEEVDVDLAQAAREPIVATTPKATPKIKKRVGRPKKAIDTSTNGKEEKAVVIRPAQSATVSVLVKPAQHATERDADGDPVPGIDILRELTARKEDWHAPLTDKQKLQILTEGPFTYIEKLRGILAHLKDEVERLKSGKKRGYSSGVMTKPVISFVCERLLPLVQGKAGEEYLFTSQTPLGKMGRAPKNHKGPYSPINYNTFRLELKRELERLGIRGKVCTQSFRKSFANAVHLMGGNDPVKTAKLLGHKDTSTVLNYLRLPDKELVNTFDKSQAHMFGQLASDGGAGSGSAESPRAPRLLSKARPEATDLDTGLELEPSVGVDLEKGTRALTPQELQRLLSEGWTHKPQTRVRMVGLIAALASWGCRISAALNLKVEDVFHVESATFYKQVQIHDKGTRGSKQRKAQRKADLKRAREEAAEEPEFEEPAQKKQREE